MRYPPMQDTVHVLVCGFLDLLERNGTRTDDTRLHRNYWGNEFCVPITDPTDWCGEWQAKRSKREGVE